MILKCKNCGKSFNLSKLKHITDFTCKCKIQIHVKVYYDLWWCSNIVIDDLKYDIRYYVNSDIEQASIQLYCNNKYRFTIENYKINKISFQDIVENVLKLNLIT